VRRDTLRTAAATARDAWALMAGDEHRGARAWCHRGAATSCVQAAVKQHGARGMQANAHSCGTGFASAWRKRPTRTQRAAALCGNCPNRACITRHTCRRHARQNGAAMAAQQS
jgi:hypothetical protein